MKGCLMMVLWMVKEFSFNNGNLYIGEFKEGKRHGLGVFTYKNGNKYVGDFLDGNMHGQGTFTYPNGDKRVGVWERKAG